MRKITLSLVWILCTLSVFAQKELVFTNATTNKVIKMRVGNKATLLYKGYNNQIEFAQQMVTEITDSTITLGIQPVKIFSGEPLKPGKRLAVYKTIRIEDIVGFRKMSAGRLLAKALVNLGGVVGSYYLLSSIYSSNIGAGYSILLSMGVGLAILQGNELLFPENVKYYMEDGWKVTSANRQR